MFSVYNKYKEGKIFVSLNMSRNKESLCKHENVSAKPVLGDVQRCSMSEGGLLTSTPSSCPPVFEACSSSCS
jgi:hypothetical protein